MDYHALLIGIDYNLFDRLTIELQTNNIVPKYALTPSDGIRLFTKQRFDLLFIDLQDVMKCNRLELLSALRSTKFTPILVLIHKDTIDEADKMIDCGVDSCVLNTTAPLLIAKCMWSLIRRYVSYNHFDQPNMVDAAAFQCGDIYIDPLRHMVQVCNHPMALRPREFALLLYFMQNPQIVLTAAQICERAWGKEDGFGRNVAQPVSELRKRIELDPSNPAYIETVYGVGYRFTAHRSETCG